MEKKNLKFDELELSNNIKKALNESGYVEATEIQTKAIPLILQGRDLIGQSQTGTGKTASYGLPMLQMIDKSSRKIQSIVLCPTRELAIQITDELRKFLKYEEGIKCLAIYGGQSIERQIKDLKGGPQIIVGTPGRVMDHMRRKTIKLNTVKMVVMDEADEMLNMGFEEDMETILKDVPEDRQTVLFSATMNRKILGITKKYLKNPENIKIKVKELTVENIKQVSIEVKSRMKNETVIRLLEVLEPKKAVIFCNTKKKVDELIEELKQGGFKAEALHGDIKQIQRDRIMKNLKAGKINILVATDVAARGIDVKELELVINYDIPQEQEYYVHRIGRTGRNGENGLAYTLYAGKEISKIRDIERYANTRILKGKIPTLTEVEEIRNRKIVSKIQEVIDSQEFVNTRVIKTLVKDGNTVDSIAAALITMLTSKKTISASEAEVPTDYEVNNEGNVRLFINVGKKDKVMVKDIVGSIAANTAVSGSDIGKINLLDNYSFVDVPAEDVAEVIKSMHGKQIKGRDVNIEVANAKK